VLAEGRGKICGIGEKPLENAIQLMLIYSGNHEETAEKEETVAK